MPTKRDPTDPTFAEAVALYIAWSKRRGLKANTILRYESVAKQNLCPRIGKLRLSQIERYTIVGLRDDLGARLGSCSINHIRIVLVGAYKAARRECGYAGPDYTEHFDPARVSKPAEVDVYSPLEVEMLIGATVGEMDAALLGVLAFAGLRKSEARGLRWGDVDFNRSMIQVRVGYTDAGGSGRPKAGQGRPVPMIQRVADLLTALYNQQVDWCNTPPTTDDLVFHVAYMTLSSSYPGRCFQAAATKAGLRRIRLHDLRHSWISMAIAAYPLPELQLYSGHADVRTTMRYVHLRPQEDAARRLEVAISE